MIKCGNQENRENGRFPFEALELLQHSPNQILSFDLTALAYETVSSFISNEFDSNVKPFIRRISKHFSLMPDPLNGLNRIISIFSDGEERLGWRKVKPFNHRKPPTLVEIHRKIEESPTVSQLSGVHLFKEIDQPIYSLWKRLTN